ncbi:zinc-binding dehydrogenase [Nonomuraea sp. NPDC046802]|uniref:zinc-binding dehydrogenase n=1 Tax=Nonomuraea sp. NPDC046802 TaxID=3154919 RepID=UPI0033D2FC64
MNRKSSGQGDAAVLQAPERLGQQVAAHVVKDPEDGFGGLGRAEVGWASSESTVIDFEEERMKGGTKRLEPFTVAAPFGPDLDFLIHLLQKGELNPKIGWRGRWDRVDEAIDALFSRRVLGKAVLDLTR